MSSPQKTDEKEKVKQNYKQFDKFLKIGLLIGIIIISGFILYFVFVPKPGSATIGFLNSEGRADNYPTQAAINQNVSFYVTVGNYLNRDSLFQVEILKGNNDTVLGPYPSINATSYLNITEFSIHHNQIWTSNLLNITFSQPGSNQIIIAELWYYVSLERTFFNVVSMRLNITS